MANYCYADFNVIAPDEAHAIGRNANNQRRKQ